MMLLTRMFDLNRSLLKGATRVRRRCANRVRSARCSELGEHASGVFKRRYFSSRKPYATRSMAPVLLFSPSQYRATPYSADRDRRQFHPMTIDHLSELFIGLQALPLQAGARVREQAPRRRTAPRAPRSVPHRRTISAGAESVRSPPPCNSATVSRTQLELQLDPCVASDRASAAWCGRTAHVRPAHCLHTVSCRTIAMTRGKELPEHAPEAAPMAKNRQIGMCPEEA